MRDGSTGDVKIDNNSDFLEVIGTGIEDLERVRADLLCDLDSAGVDELAESHAVIALDLLSMARQNLKLAKMHQMRAAGNV